MPSDQQLGVLALFEHLEKPVGPEAYVGLCCGAKPPTDEELAQLCETFKLEERGIGKAILGKPCNVFDSDIMKEASSVAALLIEQKDYDAMILASAALRSKVNEELYVYGLMYAFLNRKDTRQFQMPPVEEVVPYWFFPSTVVAAADRQLKETKSTETSVVVPYRFAHNELDPEYRMAYFREDISVNSHHWHWHLAYPNDWVPKSVDEIKDRKGELFYYMHSQILARYDTDRMANDLSRVRPLNDFRQGLGSGYFPNLVSTISGRQYSARPSNMKMVDTTEVGSIDQMELWKSRVMEVIHTRSSLDLKRATVKLEDPHGIDILAELLESTEMSVNRPYYGNYHNNGHKLIARVHDPDGRFGAEVGVMGNNATAMRDPIFYRWHRSIDDMFDEYKQSQKPYTRAELEWTGVKVSRILVRGDITMMPNFLKTFWTEREVLLSRGVDFGKSNSVKVSFNHLDHEEFVFNIDVENTTGKEVKALARIFLAPISNEQRAPMSFREQRRFFIELDKFTVTVNPGKQTLTRRSELSNVTLPTVKGYEALESEPAADAPLTTQQAFCGCGWPHHLLIPKGRPQGMYFLLFAMFTNWEEDKIIDLPEKVCGDSASYCGIRDERYPDKRSMGFPFDKPFAFETTLQTFLTDNMTTTKVVIQHTGEIKDLNGKLREAPIS